MPEFKEPVLRDTAQRDERYNFVIECQYLTPAVLRRQRDLASASGG